jgi:hypothetical protein
VLSGRDLLLFFHLAHKLLCLFVLHTHTHLHVQC